MRRKKDEKRKKRRKRNAKNVAENAVGEREGDEIEMEDEEDVVVDAAVNEGNISIKTSLLI